MRQLAAPCRQAEIEVAATCRKMPSSCNFDLTASCGKLPSESLHLRLTASCGKLPRLAVAILTATWRQLAATCREVFNGNLTATCGNLPQLAPRSLRQVTVSWILSYCVSGGKGKQTPALAPNFPFAGLQLLITSSRLLAATCRGKLPPADGNLPQVAVPVARGNLRQVAASSRATLVRGNLRQLATTCGNLSRTALCGKLPQIVASCSK